MRRFCAVLAVLALFCAGCGVRGEEAVQAPEPVQAAETPAASEEAKGLTAEEEAENGTAAEEESTGLEEEMKLWIEETEVPVTWEDNASVEALKSLCPLTVAMSMYGGVEQVGPIGKKIVRDDRQTTTNYGDIVLYSGNQIVLFYGSNSWAYTRLGHMELSQEELEKLLGNGDVTVTLQ